MIAINAAVRKTINRIITPFPRFPTALVLKLFARVLYEPHMEPVTIASLQDSNVLPIRGLPRDFVTILAVIEPFPRDAPVVVLFDFAMVESHEDFQCESASAGTIVSVLPGGVQ